MENWKHCAGLVNKSSDSTEEKGGVTDNEKLASLIKRGTVCDLGVKIIFVFKPLDSDTRPGGKATAWGMM